MTTQRTSEDAGVPLAVVAVVAGVAWWVIGYLPWVITGFDGSMDLYYLDADYYTALPLHGYGGRLMFEFGVIGGLCASLAGFVGGARRSTTWIATLIGMASAIVLTLLQSYVAVQLAETPLGGTDPMSLSVVAFGCVSGSIAGLALGMVAMLGRVWLGLVVSVLATMAAGWAYQLGTQGANTLHRITHGAFDLRPFAEEALSWSWAVLLVIALVTIGALPRIRLALWPAAVLIAWFAATPGFVLGITTMAIKYDDGRINVVEQTWDWITLIPPKETVIRCAIAIVVAGVVTFGIEYWRSRQASQSTQPQPDTSMARTGSH